MTTLEQMAKNLQYLGDSHNSLLISQHDRLLGIRTRLVTLHREGRLDRGLLDELLREFGMEPYLWTEL